MSRLVGVWLDFDPLRQSAIGAVGSDEPSPRASDLGCSRGWWSNEQGLHAILSLCSVILEIVFIVWLTTCVLHGLRFFASGIVSDLSSTRGPARLNPALSPRDSKQVANSHVFLYRTFRMPRTLFDAVGLQFDFGCQELLNRTLTFLY